MKRKWKIVLLICFAVVSVAFVSQRIVSKQGERILSEKEIQNIVSDQYPGKIKSLKLINKGERDVYKVNISNKQGAYEIIVDAENGDIKHAKELAVQQVPGNVKGIKLKQKNEKKVYEIEIEKNASENVIVEIEETTGAFVGTSQIQKVITEEQAKGVALQKVPDGSIEKVSLAQFNGASVYQIIIKKQAETLDIRVHTITGEVVSTTTINNAIQQKESSNTSKQQDDDQEEGNDDQENDDD
ncbi:TPA: PepSY domain-containing protein [Bacillus luti]